MRIRHRSDCHIIKKCSLPLCSLQHSYLLSLRLFCHFQQRGLMIQRASFSLLQQTAVEVRSWSVAIKPDTFSWACARLPTIGLFQPMWAHIDSDRFNLWLVVEKWSFLFFCISALQGGKHIHHSPVSQKGKKSNPRTNLTDFTTNLSSKGRGF